VSSEFARSRLSEELEQALRLRMTTRTFRKGATLYQKGLPANGIYLLDKGTVRMLWPRGINQSQLLEVVGSGTLLGLSDTMAGGHYRVTAQAEENITAAFVSRDDLMQFLVANQEYCMQVVRLLSDSLHGLYHKFRSVSAHPGRPRRPSLDERMG
jgi:CRP-like cAMP-binding protein